MKKRLLLLGVTVLCLSLSTTSKGYEIKTELLGSMEVSGTLSGYFITGNKVSEEAKKTRTDLGSAVLSFSKKAEPVGFVLISGAYAFPTIGVDPLKTTDYTDIFSPLPVAYLEISALKNLSLSVGRMGTLIGFEAPFTFQNNYLQRGLLWNMQSIFHHGLRLSYLSEKYSFKVGVNDGYYSLGADSFKNSGKSKKYFSPALEASFSVNPVKELTLGLNVLLPEKEARPNETTFPANKRQYNLVASYQKGNFSVGLDSLWIEAPSSEKAKVVKKAKAWGLALHLAFDKAPLKFAGRVEYLKDKEDEGEIDLVGLGNKNRALTLTFSPGYYKEPFFLRLDLSYVKAKEEFTYQEKKTQKRFGFELGIKF